MRSRMMLVLLALACSPLLCRADEPNEVPQMPTVVDEAQKPAEANTPAPADAQQPAPEDVMKQMLEEQREAPIIEPTARPSDEQGTPRRAKAPTASVNVDASVLGIAPGGKQPTLRREGEFIVGRRGRLVRSPDGEHMLYVFDADAEDSPETPLVILPCQMLQSMEDIVQQRGDRVVFILSGQITAYRGANYVMPTMMKLALDRGNLQ